MIDKTCRDCGRPIVLRKTVKGAWAPIDPEPSPAGIYAVHDSGAAELYVGDQLEEARGKAVPLYAIHFDTCPKIAPAPVGPF
jgi:hypothetical protein